MTDPGGSNTSVVRCAARTIRSAPFTLLLAQIPEMSIDLFDKFLEPRLGGSPWLMLVTLVPYFIVASAVSTALTFALVMQHRASEPASLRRALRSVAERAGPLLAASFFAGALVLLGVALLFLPGLYFLTLYLYVPYIVMAEPVQPASVYLVISKRLAKAHFWKTFGLTVLLLVVGLALYGVGEAIEGQARDSAAAGWAAGGINVFLSLVAGCMMNVGVSHYFVKLRSDPHPQRAA